MLGFHRLLTVLLLVASLAVGCSDDAPNEQSAPEFAFRAFRASLDSGTAESALVTWSFLGPQTQAALEQRAEARAAAGVPVAHASELLRASWVPGAADIDTLERVEYTDDHALLRMTTVLGETSDVRLLRSDRGWRVELALAPTVEGSGE